jgi:hypothetical protein
MRRDSYYTMHAVRMAELVSPTGRVPEVLPRAVSASGVPCDLAHYTVLVYTCALPFTLSPARTSGSTEAP